MKVEATGGYEQRQGQERGGLESDVKGDQGREDARGPELEERAAVIRPPVYVLGTVSLSEGEGHGQERGGQGSVSQVRGDQRQAGDSGQNHAAAAAAAQILASFGKHPPDTLTTPPVVYGGAGLPCDMGTH